MSAHRTALLTSSMLPDKPLLLQSYAPVWRSLRHVLVVLVLVFVVVVVLVVVVLVAVVIVILIWIISRRMPVVVLVIPAATIGKSFQHEVGSSCHRGCNLEQSAVATHLFLSSRLAYHDQHTHIQRVLVSSPVYDCSSPHKFS